MAELERVAGLVGVEDELHQSRPVAQVDEDEPSVVSAAMHPARDPHLGADPVRQHLAAPGVAVGVRSEGWELVAHGDESVSTSVAGSTCRSSPESMSRRVDIAFSARISA